MIHKFRTVHFKRQLSTAITVNPINQNGRNHHFNNEFSHLGRLRASVAGLETTHFLSSYLTPSLLSIALKNSARMGSFLGGLQLHGYLYKSGLCNVLSLQNQLLNVYVKCKEFHDACNLFDEMLVRNIVTWNTLLCGLATCGAGFRSIFDLGFPYFKRMLSQMMSPDCITFTSLLRVSIELDDVEIGRQLHCIIVKLGLCVNCFVSSALVDFYSKFGLVGDARCTFDCCLGKDLVLWNVMVSCYVSNCLEKDALLVFSLMRLEGVNGDGFTFSNLLNASAVLGCSVFGRQLHSLVISLSFDLDVVVASTLVDMYAKNENIEDARKTFDEMVFRNIILWNTMIVGYGQHGDRKEAVELLVEMFREDLHPDELTLASVLSSCGNLSSFSEIVQLHAYAIKVGLQTVLSIANSLINAYSKCGTIAVAFKCFSSISEPDIVSWASMIRAYAFNGLPRKGIELFDEMLLNGKTPDRVAFLGVLSACSHGGLVDEGLHYFNLMTNVYNIEPHSEHYTCLIDVLGRLGLVDHALEVLTSMPFEPGSDQLGAFIGACKVHGNSELANWAAEKLFVLEPGKHANYTLLCNTYASKGCWVDVARVRKMMRNRCNDKVPGCSWIEIADVHELLDVAMIPAQ
ncbi:pentatricopeptide repeat-containing protein At2g46050, mitochondrial isoform X2 [Rhododendron vialii]|uniref:pentatricopeptide repeat-containing protein At2g46050, mitochondrial isoform X2 n=1 Tax=Rhododendron vialii TaxID=182163 RepID=UPI00265E64E5|nr:pentatricopeptide repeat-containing protein At2g46050, mitochondrial isoform X2 [Rhododendron vialii]